MLWLFPRPENGESATKKRNVVLSKGATKIGLCRSQRFGHMRSVRTLLGVGMATCLLAVQALGQTNASTPVEPRATGLRPPTAEERAWMVRELKDTRRVLPNKLAIERLNRERQRRGLMAISVPSVPMGEEVQSTGEPALSPTVEPWFLAAQSTTASTGTVGLPSAVDNSTLKFFPPVRNQDELGSCVSFSVGYYTGTHMMALARGIDARDIYDNSTKVSPKWIYNFVNRGENNGSWFAEPLDVLLKLGVPSWQMFPYLGNKNVPANYLEWSRDPAVWRAAVSNRFKEAGAVQNTDTPNGLNILKGLLANGYILPFATSIGDNPNYPSSGWQFNTISDDSSTANDNALVGKQVCYQVNGLDPLGVALRQLGGHAMTIVGYNDDIWTDIDRDGMVDSGEKGALKIVNSWGSWWKDGGFTWIAYDALRMVSAVTGVSSSTSRVSAFYDNQVYWVTARAAYTPSLLGEFTLSHSSREDLYLRVGASGTVSSGPETYFPNPDPSVYNWQGSNRAPLVFKNLGGCYAFDGGTSAVDGTFVFDLTDIMRQGAAKYYLVAGDENWGNPCTVKSFRLTSPSGQTLATHSSSLPMTVDAGTTQVSAQFNNQPLAAPVINSGTAAAGTVGELFNFQITAANSPTSFSASALPPGLSVNAANGAITGTPTQAGTFVATVSASNASGTGSATLTFTINTPLLPAPQITSATTASGTVGVPFSYQIAANGSPSAYGASSLPPGTDVNPATGFVSGTPTQAGLFEMTVSAANAGGSGNQKVYVTIAPAPAQAPVITSPDNAGGTSGSSFTYRIEASNSPTSYGAEGLPSTLTINTSTGVITGVLPAARTYYITLRASNAAGSGFKELALSVTGEALIGPSNDSFANAIVIDGATSSGSGNNAQATSEPGEPSHAGQTSHSVWWSWTAPYSGPATVSTAGSSFDTVLAIYTGSSVSALSKVGENDDASGVKTSAISFAATAGITYMIAVDGFGAATGDISLGVQQQASSGPANDAFASRSVLSGSIVSIRASNAGATREEGEPSHAGYTAAKSVWWTWTAPSNGRVTLDTIGSSIDTLLAVYSGNVLSQLVPVASDDQSGGDNTSLLRFPAVQGATYQIAVDGWDGAAGGIALNLLLEQTSGPDNDDFALAREATGVSGSEASTNQDATAEGGEPAHAGSAAVRSVWWKWTAPATGAVRWDTIGSSFDTVLAVYTGSSVQALTPVASDDQSGGDGTSALEFEAISGATYYVAVDGYGGANGNIKLSHSYAGTPSNDNFADAATIQGSSATVSGGNANATAETDEPSHAGAQPSNSLWWHWTPITSGSVTMSTAGSTFDTVLAVYTGSSLAELQQVSSSDDFGNALTSEVTFSVQSGTTYYIAVDGYNGQTGQVQLAVNQGASATLYETDFENFPFGADSMAGFDGWTISSPGSGACGIFQPDGVSKSAWLGFNAASASFAYISRPVNYQPAAEDDGVVVFRSNMTMFDSTANTDFRRDWFAIELVDMSGAQTASIWFDNETGGIWIYEPWQSEASRFVSTGVYFSKGERRELSVVYDLKTKTWTASWGETPLFETRPLSPNTAGNLSIGSVDVSWYQSNPEGFGDNFLVLDDYSLSTSAAAVPVITSAQEASAALGQSFTYQITASNDPTSYSAFGLPSGLSADSQTGLVTGAPQQAGLFAVVLGAENTAGSDTKVLFLSVSSGATTPVITSAQSASGKVGEYFEYQITADNGPTDFSADGLPAGLNVDSYTGLISGTPSAAGNYNVTLYATNTQGTATASLNLTVVSTNANLSGLTLSKGTLSPVFSSSNTSYTAAVSYLVSSLTLTANAEESNATVSVNGVAVGPGGTSSQIPLQVGVNSIAIQVTAQDGITTKTYTLNVSRAPGTTFTSWSSNSALSASLLAKYAIGGAPSKEGNSEAPRLTISGTTISLTAIVRADDPALSVTGLVSSDLVTWTGSGVSVTVSPDTMGVPEGCQRLIFSATAPGGAKKHFMRLRASLADQ